MKPLIGDHNVQAFIEQLWDSVFITDNNKTILYWNQAAADLTGYEAEETVGQPCKNILCVHQEKTMTLCSISCPCSHVQRQKQPYERHLTLRTKEGLTTPLLHRILPRFENDEHDKVIGCIHILRKLNTTDETKELIEKLNYLAYIEPLTKTSRRDYGETILRRALDDFFYAATFFGILLIDLDKLKHINDTRGHLAGDHVLVSVAAAIKENIRQSDLLARYGGDEFLLICPNFEPAGLKLLGNKLCEIIKNLEPTYNDIPISISISVGGTVPANGDTIKSLITRADANMYLSKNQGGNQCIVS